MFFFKTHNKILNHVNFVNNSQIPLRTSNLRLFYEVENIVENVDNTTKKGTNDRTRVKAEILFIIQNLIST